MTLVTIIAILMVLLAPASVGSAAFLWQIHAESRRLDDRYPKPHIRLSLIMAVTGTFAAAAASLLGVAAGLYLLGNSAASTALSPLILVAFVLLDLIPVVNAAYLKLLDGPLFDGRRPEEAVPEPLDDLR